MTEQLEGFYKLIMDEEGDPPPPPSHPRYNKVHKTRTVHVLTADWSLKQAVSSMKRFHNRCHQLQTERKKKK